MTSFNYSKWNTYTGWFAFIIALVTYTLTVEPTMSFWDCGEYIATAAKLEVGHPPGAPLYQMMGAFFAMFATDDTQIALMINMMSVFSSAFTILFMYWSASKIIRKVVKATSEWNDQTSKLTLGASLVAALSYTFTDSFWFNAVEAEVYSMASLFIALLFWLGLKWEEELETERGNKWLILISLVIGLSFGVHFMALLTLPSIGMLYFFKKQKNVTPKNFIIANVVILAILMFIFKFLLPYTLSFFAKTEIFAVNSLGLPFNSGTIIAFILIVAGFYYGLSYTKKKGLANYNTLLLCVLFILIGFSTWIMLPVRANSNININENKPSDAAEVLAYYNREQYGETKLFYGPQFSNVYAGADEEDPYSDDKPNYERDEKTGKYIITNNYKDANHNPNSKHNAFLPRLWSEEHAKNYMTFTKPLEFSINPEAFYDEETGETNEEKLGQFTEIVSDFRTQFAKKNSPIGLDEYENFLKTYGDYLTIEKPSFSDNMKFMFEYQFGYMYFRYLMWNFVGRQNDIQGNYESLEGNWLSGIGFIDDLHLDNQSELTTDMKNNKGRNTYFFLPFILAVIGMVYHAKKEWKSFYVLLLLFLFTGLVLKVYLNERPFEPRERDYALVGSFYIFAIWIGVGIYAIYQYLLKYVNPKVALPAVLATTLLASPVILASQNWDDHDRSGKHTAVAMARAYLDSCEPNAILFTIGDNDTFPMWYLQEIEGYRTDIRIVNTSLLATDWYIDEMKVKSNKSDALPISFTHDQYVGDKRNYCLFDERTTDTLDLGLTLDFLKDDRSKREMKNGQFVHFYPSEHLKIKVDKQNIIKNKVVSPKYNDSIVDEIQIKLKGGAIYKNRILMLDIFNENNWKRPIYFSPGSFGADDYIWMKEFLQLDGMVYKLVPVRTKLQEGNYDMGYIDTDKMYAIINKWTWGNAGSDKIYHDPETRKNALSYRNNLSRLMTALIEEKKYDKAEKVIQIAMKNMPIDYFEYYTTVTPFAEGYYKIGKKEEARKILNQLMKKYQEKITFFNSQSKAQKAFYGNEINNEIKRYYMLLLVAEENNDLEFYNQQITKFNNYNKMMGDYGISIE